MQFLWPTDGNYCCCWSQRNSKDLLRHYFLTPVCLFQQLESSKKINMSYTTILYNGRKELRSYFRLGNVTEILIFKCRQKTRLSQRVMHGIHLISVTKALIFPQTTTLIEIRATYQHIEHATTPQSLMFSDAL